MSVTIQAGSRVLLRYTLAFPDGQLIEGTEGGEPAAVTIGSGDLTPFLEERLLGLAAGERRCFEIAGRDTQMPAGREALQQKVPRTVFPPEMPLAPGLVIEFQAPGGDAVPGVVTEVDATHVAVDFSHPLAGRDVIFEVEIVSILNLNTPTV